MEGPGMGRFVQIVRWNIRKLVAGLLLKLNLAFGVKPSSKPRTKQSQFVARNAGNKEGRNLVLIKGGKKGS